MNSLNEGKTRFLAVVARRVIPAAADLDTAGQTRFRALVDDALAARTPRMRRQLGLFLGLLRWAPLLIYGAPFDRLSPERQDAVLRRFESCPVLLLRRGFWGLKVILYIGYYGQVELWSSLGYAPAFDGNSQLHA